MSQLSLGTALVFVNFRGATGTPQETVERKLAEGASVLFVFNDVGVEVFRGPDGKTNSVHLFPWKDFD